MSLRARSRYVRNVDGPCLAAQPTLTAEIAHKCAKWPNLVQEYLRVVKATKYNDTAVVFHSASGESVHVVNGDAFYQSAAGTRNSVCEGSASCSALYACAFEPSSPCPVAQIALR